jgi:hypothetical protein
MKKYRRKKPDQKSVLMRNSIFFRALLLCFLVCAVLLPSTSSAQFIFDNRPAFWPSLALRKSFGDHWKIKAEHSTRLKFMPFMVDELYLQLGGEYQINYNFAVELNYRFSDVFDPETRFTPAHRISIEGDYQGHIKRWCITVHPAVQAVFSRENQMKDRDAQWAFRPKFAVDYNVRKSSLAPFVSLEFYMGRRSGEAFSIYKYRLTGGLGGDVCKTIKLTGYVRQQGGFLSTNISSYTILGIDLLYKL